jgi:hypothetical protein
MRIQSEERKAGAQIGVKSAGEKAKMEQEAAKFQQQQQAEGVRMGLDAAKTKSQQEMQREQAAKQHNLSINQLMKQSAKQPKEE